MRTGRGERGWEEGGGGWARGGRVAAAARVRGGEERRGDECERGLQVGRERNGGRLRCGEEGGEGAAGRGGRRGGRRGGSGGQEGHEGHEEGGAQLHRLVDDRAEIWSFQSNQPIRVIAFKHLCDIREVLRGSELNLGGMVYSKSFFAVCVASCAAEALAFAPSPSLRAPLPVASPLLLPLCLLQPL